MEDEGDNPRLVYFLQERFLPTLKHLRAYEHPARCIDRVCRFLDAGHPNLRLSQVNRSHVEELRRFYPDVKPRTRNMYQQRLSQALNYAVDVGLLAANPIARVKSETVDNRKERTLTMGEFVAIIRAAEVGEAHDLFLVAALTGLRPSNVRLLRHDEIDDAMVRIPPEKSKNKRWIVVPASPVVAGALEKHIDNGSDFVFPARGTTDKAKSPRNLLRTFKAACGHAGVGWNVAVYDLRHFFASQLTKQGVNEQQIARLLCQVPQSVTSRYVHYDVEDLRPFVDELADRYLDAAGAPSLSRQQEGPDDDHITV